MHAGNFQADLWSPDHRDQCLAPSFEQCNKGARVTA
jgi:hypothetical protein